MSGCPAYLGVVINNRLELDELFRYDTLILCPPEFNLTFKVRLLAVAFVVRANPSAAGFAFDFRNHDLEHFLERCSCCYLSGRFTVLVTTNS